MRRKHTWALGAIALLTLAAATAALTIPRERPARADMRSMASPGKLASAHAALDKQCDKCHVPFQGVPNSSCLDCHAATAKRIATGHGTHAAFGARKCVECHKDHRGRDHALSPPIDVKSFDHKITGFALDGAHANARCATCHPGGSGHEKWVGMPATCVGCHADPHHKGTLGTSCDTCHTPKAWSQVKFTVAQHKLPMNGGHQDLSCVQCHSGGKHLTSTFRCDDCHQQKHGGTKAACDHCHNVKDWKSATFLHDFCTCILPGKHITAPCLSCHPAFKFNPTPLTCAGCHDNPKIRQDRKHDDLGPCARCHSALSWKKKVFDHDKQVPKFPITGRHNEVGCENCHKKPGVFKGAPTACEGCHKVPTHGDFGACARCHTTAGFDKPTFSHASTRFPLDGPHTKVACQTCHTKFKKGSFQPGPNACALCHGDPHQGQFTNQNVDKVTPPSGMSPGNPPLGHPHQAPDDGLGAAHGGTSPRFACLDCHDGKTWSPSTITAQTHARFAFALVGSHQKVACARCHPGGAQARFVDTPTRCASCHMDAHAGRLGQECQKCHDPSTWHHTPGFDHAKVSGGFALAGAHQGVDCAACHGETGHALDEKAQPITCASCHTPKKHGAQFGARCDECHQPTTFSDVTRFDHRRTLFPLERRHQEVACLECHDGRRQPRAVAECNTCHGDPHRGAAGSQCQDCHRPDRWLLIRFDHDRAEWPLNGRHFVTPCLQCHKNNQWTGLRTECVSCHALDRPATSHPNRFDCECCHKSFNWKLWDESLCK